MDRLTVTVEQAAEMLGVSRNSAYALAKNGTLPVVKLGRRLVVPKKRLDDLLSGDWQPPRTS